MHDVFTFGLEGCGERMGAGCGGRKDEGDAGFEDGEEVEKVVEGSEVGSEVAFVERLSASVGCREGKLAWVGE
jgi:hypothetical protein